MGFSAGISLRRLTSSPEAMSVTHASGTSLPPAGRVLVAVVGPDADVEVAAVVGVVARVVAEVAVRAGDGAADLVVGGLAGACSAGAAGRAALLAVVNLSRVAAVEEVEGAGPAVEDVVGPAGAMAAGSAVPAVSLQPEPASNRTTPRATPRRRSKARYFLSR
jgi:hypothetical protein